MTARVRSQPIAAESRCASLTRRGTKSARPRRSVLPGRAPLALVMALLTVLVLIAPSARAQERTQRGESSGRAAAFQGKGMWIWIVRRAHGGRAAAIAAQARRHGVSTVYVKSSDGSRPFAQFSPAFVRELKARGLRVCAWPYVYGRYPVTEARLSAQAVRAGADCLVIDAEGEYEGKYAQAETYIQTLRSEIGNDYPLGLAGLPYVHYHPAFPYSVFLGPRGAQFNLPQMYWRAIGVSVDRVFSTTYRYNGVYGRPIFPLGQLYMEPPGRELTRFRQLAVAYGATGVSWWSWHEASAAEWRTLGREPLPASGDPPPEETYPLLRRGSRGDLVVWAEQHLLSAGQRLAVNGIFGPLTEDAVRAFQAERGLPVTGQIGPLTWEALLPYGPTPVSWNPRRRARASVAGRRRGERTGPPSAWLPAVRNELARKPRP